MYFVSESRLCVGIKNKKFYMSYDEEELEGGFRMSDSDEDEPLDIPAEMTDFGLDEEDPDKDR